MNKSMVDKDGNGIGYIYFAQCATTGNIKIGKTTNNPFFRINQINGMSPTYLTLIGYTINTHSQFETEIHKRFRQLRIDGKKEWFIASDELTSFIKSISDQTGEHKPLLRAMKNKTQLDICKQAAISSGFLSLLLSGERRPSWNTAKRLADVTGTEPVLWLEGTPESLRQIITDFIQSDIEGGEN